MTSPPQLLENPEGDTEYSCAAAKKSVQAFRAWQRRKDEKDASQWLCQILDAIKEGSRNGKEELRGCRKSRCLPY
jgi:hypothetical protein